MVSGRSPMTKPKGSCNVFQIVPGMPAYEGLPHIHDVDPYTEARDGDRMLAACSLLVRENVHDILGIAFPLHFHLQLDPNAIMLERVERDAFVAEAVDIGALSGEKAHPSLFRFTNDGTRVLHWSVGVDPEAERVSAFFSSPALTTFRAILGDDLPRWGLGRIGASEINLPEGMIWVEKQVGEHALVKRLLPINYGDNAIQTHWYASPAGNGRVIARCNVNYSTDANGNHAMDHAG